LGFDEVIDELFVSLASDVDGQRHSGEEGGRNTLIYADAGEAASEEAGQHSTRLLLLIAIHSDQSLQSRIERMRALTI
jgi:hypothetical protein